MVPSYHLSIETPTTPLVLGVGVMFAPVTCCDFCAFGSATQWECFVRRVLALRKTSSRPSGSVPSAPPTSPHAETSSGVSLPGASSSFLPLGGQGKREGSRGAPGVCLGVLPPLPLDLGLAGGVAVVWGVRARSRFSFSFSFGSGRSGGCPLAVGFLFSAFPTSLSSPQFSPHVPRRENSRETS